MLEKLEKYMELKRGYDLPSYERVNGIYPIVSSSRITEFHNEFKVKGPGVITGRSGTIGEVFFENRDFWPLNTSLYVKDFKGNNKKFIYYFLKNLDFKHLASATAVPSLDRKILHSLRVPFIEKSIQNKIAKLLSNYDDLIENNNKRIKLLESMAEELYKEWFVRLRFPNYQNTKIEDGIPERWEEKCLSNIMSFINGYAFRSSDFTENGSTIIKIKNINNKTVDIDNTDKVLDEITKKLDNKFQLFENDLIIAMTGATVGKLGFIPKLNEKTFLNQRVGKIVSKYKYFIYLVLNSCSGQQNIINLADGAAQPNISSSQILKIKCVLPTEEILKEFENILENIYLEIFNLRNKNQTLKQTRDLLLPRLLSGKLDIEKLDIN